MVNTGSTATFARRGRNAFWLCLLCLLGALLVLFYRSLESGQVLFSNDGPLGALMADQVRSANPLTGFWTDLSWVGVNSGSASPGPTTLLFEILGSPAYSKFYGPITLLFLGLSTWLCFRQWGFKPAVCVLGALAATLNMNTFSNVCWGLGTRATCMAATFLALAAIGQGWGKLFWARYALAGLALGVGVMEGADNGAIYSVYVAAFIVFLALLEVGAPGTKLAKGIGRVVLVAGFALFMASQTLIALIGTQITGVAGMEQTQEAKEQRWDQATQWSLPVKETLRVIIPGVFGYRMFEPGNPPDPSYWGTVGRQPGWEQHHQGFPRHSGSGEYAGVLVVLIALWGCAQSFRRSGDIFNDRERKIIWFWMGAAFVSLLLAWGRYAPFYRMLYALPYFSTIRNPIKFMHPFHLSLLILFTYGLHGLSRRYLESATAKSDSMLAQVKAWWAKAPSFEKKWTLGSGAAVVLSILGYLAFSGSRKDLMRYLEQNGFATADAGSIARFSAGEVGLYTVFLVASVALVTMVLSGAFAGRRARWAGISLGLLLVVDLARANTPWIKYYDYKDKYASNPIIDILRQKPYEHRLAMPPFRAGQQFDFFQQVYGVEWLQHLFLYYNVQSLDMAQDPRPSADKLAYRAAVMSRTVTNITYTTNGSVIATNSTPVTENTITRLWELTNTRYVCGMAGGFVDSFNQLLDPQKRRFKVHTLFTFAQSPTGNGIIVQTNDTGPFALLEFTGALPRTKLYSHWLVSKDDQATLQRLNSPGFDPQQLVLVGDDVPPPPSNVAVRDNPGTVQFASYSPKHEQLRSEAAGNTLLLLNDKFDPDWKVRVDGQSAKVLRCNFLMRGVYLPPGAHTIDFQFQPSLTPLYITTSAIGTAVLLCGFVIWAGRRETPPNVEPAKAAPKAKQAVS